MRIDYERDGYGYGNGYGDGYNYDRGDGFGFSNGFSNGHGDGYYGYNAPHTLYFMHPFAPLADFDAWMLHLQVEERVRR